MCGWRLSPGFRSGIEGALCTSCGTVAGGAGPCRYMCGDSSPYACLAGCEDWSSVFNCMFHNFNQALHLALIGQHKFSYLAASTTKQQPITGCVCKIIPQPSIHLACVLAIHARGKKQGILRELTVCVFKKGNSFTMLNIIAAEN
jgi:hypothetical protein